MKKVTCEDCFYLKWFERKKDYECDHSSCYRAESIFDPICGDTTKHIRIAYLKDRNRKGTCRDYKFDVGLLVCGIVIAVIIISCVVTAIVVYGV